jgi:formylglycine-generating enzyme required for sulfatase activity
MRSLLPIAALLLALPARALPIDWVPVGDAGNPADVPATNCDSANCGSVNYDYYISKYEVTNPQYAAFLNAAAASDPLGLYNTGMGSDASFGGITQSGSDGSYSYTVKAGFEDKPVTYVSFYDALRFSNWLNNGEGAADTETGAYELLGGTPVPSNGATVTREPGASTFLPSENEWYKAAYYSPGGVYFDYPTRTDTLTDCVAPGADTGNSANCASGALTIVGAYGLSDSPYGTFDQGGNLWEWNEQIVNGFAWPRAGNWEDGAGNLAASAHGSEGLAAERDDFGFRVASLVPEPAQVLLVLTGGLVLAGVRRRRA